MSGPVQTMTWRRRHAGEYLSVVVAFGGSLPLLAGVYIVLRRRDVDGTPSDVLFIGSATNLDGAAGSGISLHPKWNEFCAYGASHVAAIPLFDVCETRLALEAELIELYDPTLNQKDITSFYF